MLGLNSNEKLISYQSVAVLGFENWVGQNGAKIYMYVFLNQNSEDKKKRSSLVKMSLITLYIYIIKTGIQLIK